MVHTITKSPSSIDLWLWVSLKKSTNIFVEGQIWKHPSAWNATGKREVGGPCRAETWSCSRWETMASLSMPGCETAGISTRRLQLRIKVSPLRHMETMCTYFCFCGSALGNCLTAAGRARFLNSHMSQQAALSWALGLPGRPSSSRLLYSCLWPLFPVEPASLGAPNNWQTRVSSQLSGSLDKVYIYFGFSYSPFPCFPKKEAHTKGRRSATWSCLYSCTCKAEKTSPDAGEDKLFQDERALLLVLLRFPRAECVASLRVLKSATTLRTILYLSAFVRKPLQGKDEFVKNI